MPISNRGGELKTNTGLRDQSLVQSAWWFVITQHKQREIKGLTQQYCVFVLVNGHMLAKATDQHMYSVKGEVQLAPVSVDWWIVPLKLNMRYRSV